jgi:hypothetical protein
MARTGQSKADSQATGRLTQAEYRSG